jgi:thiol-disulfide isomerase/thioredoxin
MKMMGLVRSSLLLALTLFTAASAGAAEEVWIPREQRAPAPRLVLSDIPGARRQLTQLKGKVVVVNFWATWCVPCQAEMPEFSRVYDEYRSRGVEFLGAANEPRSSRPKVQDFIKQFDVRFPVWLEASEDNMKAFGVGAGLPGTVLIDAEGRIAAQIAGVTDGAHIARLLDRLLSEPPAAARTGGR